MLTFDTAELVATKIRALFQRSKGRDLFDLWLALVRLGIEPLDIIEAFVPYRPNGYQPLTAVQNLRRKVDSADFRSDLDQLVTRWPEGYEVEAAAEIVIRMLLDGLG